MTELEKWEYRVESFGSTLKSPNDEELQELLDEWGEEGWEVFTLISYYGTNRIRIFARRPLSHRARRERSMPV